MKKHEQYNLSFAKIISNNIIQYDCYQINNLNNFGSLAEKLRLMHKIECEGLIQEIILSQNEEYFEQYFSLDRSGASDNESIEITKENVIIDGILIIPNQDMKLLLDEWLNFMNT